MATLNATDKLQEKGKKAAGRFLMRRGYKILERDWRSKTGGVDFIATDEESLVFVDVKTRTNKDTGFPEEQINKDSRRKREMIAIEYLTQIDASNTSVRFDTVSLLVVSDERAFLRHHINALSLSK